MNLKSSVRVKRFVTFTQLGIPEYYSQEGIPSGFLCGRFGRLMQIQSREAPGTWAGRCVAETTTPIGCSPFSLVAVEIFCCFTDKVKLVLLSRKKKPHGYAQGKQNGVFCEIKKIIIIFQIILPFPFIVLINQKYQEYVVRSRACLIPNIDSRES